MVHKKRKTMAVEIFYYYTSQRSSTSFNVTIVCHLNEHLVKRKHKKTTSKISAFIDIKSMTVSLDLRSICLSAIFIKTVVANERRYS